jgi:hypothetical protein
MKVKKQGWINIYRNIYNDDTECTGVYDSKNEGIGDIDGFGYAPYNEYVTTIQIEWEEEV